MDLKKYNKQMREQFGLKDWSLEYGRKSKRRLGIAKFDEKKIQINPALKGKYFKDTFLHEVAHAMEHKQYGSVRKGQQHGQRWKRIARQIGANPNASSMPPPSFKKHIKKFKIKCPSCNMVFAHGEANTNPSSIMRRFRKGICPKCKVSPVLEM